MVRQNHSDDDRQTTTDLRDVSEGDEVEVHYETTHGNAASFTAKVQSKWDLSKGFADAVVWDSENDRRYRLSGTGNSLTVKSLRSGTPRTVGYSGEVVYEPPADPTEGVFEEAADLDEFVNGLDESNAEDGQFSLRNLQRGELPGETTLYEARPFEDTNAYGVRLVAEPSYVWNEEIHPDENRLICVFLWVEVTTPHPDPDSDVDLFTRGFLHYSPERTPEGTVEEAKELCREFGDSYEDALRMANSESNEDRMDARPEEWIAAFEEERDARDALGLDDEDDDPNDGKELVADGGFVFPEDDDEGYPADASREFTTVHGVIENRSGGIAGLCVLYSVHGHHYRVRLRPENPLDSETFDRGDAWTVYEWAEIETPDEDAPSVQFEEIHYVPAVVRETVPGVVQVPHIGGSA